VLHTLKRSQTLPVNLETAWQFFSDPCNLCDITPAWLCFRLTCDKPGPMYAGQILTYKIQALPGISLSWVTEITHVDEPRFFVDEQRMGPYAFWHHQHRFTEVEDGVLMEDEVNYSLPLGPAGDLMHRLYVAKRLQEIFDFRAQTLERIFPAKS